MKLRINIYRLLFAVISMLFPFLSSCTDWFAASISDLTVTTGLGADFQPRDKSNSFYIDSTQICCSARLIRAHRNTPVTVHWIITDGNLISGENPTIHEDTVYSNVDCYVGFTLTPSTSGFISGTYRVEMLVDGVIKASEVFYIHKEQSGALPQISNFSLTSQVITAGQSTSLNWQVTGATRIIIEPAPGKVEAKGSINITPVADTSYTLVAVNRSGVSSSKISIKVMPVITARSDLEIIDFWNTGNIIFYRILNKGNLISCPCFSAMYKNNIQEAKDYVYPLLPGEERVESFASYHFSPRFGSITGSLLEEGASDAVNIRICLNQPVSCEEATVENNCLDHNFGPLLAVNLLRYVSFADWENSEGTVKWPMGKDDKRGWATIGTAHISSGSFSNALLIAPGINDGSWIQATIGIPHGTPATLKAWEIPFKGKLGCKIGITNDAPEDASVKFMLGVKQGDKIDFFNPVTINVKDKLENYEVDLSKFAGKEVEFVLRVESGGTLQQGSAAWIDPVLSQER